MQISLAARLAYQLDKDGLLSDIISSEDISYLAGWLGDATNHNIGKQTTFGNDDYHADLDAENIFRLILGGSSGIEAINDYYGNLSTAHNRADVFLSYVDYGFVTSKTYDYLLISNLETIKIQHPDTYNFLKSLEARLADIEDFC